MEQKVYILYQGQTRFTECQATNMDEARAKLTEYLRLFHDNTNGLRGFKVVEKE